MTQRSAEQKQGRSRPRRSSAALSMALLSAFGMLPRKSSISSDSPPTAVTKSSVVSARHSSKVSGGYRIICCDRNV